MDGKYLIPSLVLPNVFKHVLEAIQRRGSSRIIGGSSKAVGEYAERGSDELLVGVRKSPSERLKSHH